MNEPRTLLDVFAAWHAASQAPALVDVRGGGERRLPAPEVASRVAGLARGLAALGIGKGDRVALLCGDRPEWHIVDFAVLHLGALDVPIYPTLLASQVGPILADSGARAIVVENTEQLAKIAEIRGSCLDLREVIVIDGDAAEGVRTLDSCAEPMDEAGAIAFLDACRAAVQAEDLATLLYTSGTTADPKGVMLTHDNFVFDAVSAASVMPWPEGDIALTFLPLSHVLERLIDYAYFFKGLTIAYCGILEAGEAMRRVRPHLFTAVPRFYEKVYDRIFHEISNARGVKRSILRRAVHTALSSVKRGRRGPGWHLFNLVVYSRVRAALGGRIRFTISGGAPLPVFVASFFHGVDVNVLEGYGLTETSPVICVNRYGRAKLGTVGPAIPGVELRIAPDGEVLTRGRHVMRGYWHKPERTAAVLDADGWFATGDIGELDADGFLRITDRKKDILVTAGGKNVAPQSIEDRLRASPLVENAVLFGDRKPYIVALIVPSVEGLESWARERGLPASDVRTLIGRDDVVEVYGRVVAEVNHDLARFETVKKFRLVPEPFTISGGELTPTLKVKRRVVETRYSAILASLYAEEASFESWG
jgi:long-chain acyl-CoA synthetase